MKNIWFTSDTHFWHNNIVKYCDRPFDNVFEMNETIINNWNGVVKKQDEVYFLGDFTLFSSRKHIIDVIRRLNYGVFHFIKGNHDSNKITNILKPYINDVYDLKKININKQTIVLCHYPMKSWYKSHLGKTWQLYGHSHGNKVSEGKQMDVGVDTHNFFPWHLDEIREVMATL